MNNISALSHAPRMLESLGSAGAFLTVSVPVRLNTMTIGWGSVSIYWGKPVFIAPVRHSRFTHSIIEEAGEFTVSFPAPGTMKEQLAFCGTKSGRDVDKFSECALQTLPGRMVDCPVIKGAGLHIECRIRMGIDMDITKMDAGIAAMYRDGDAHTLYFGEIIDCYME